MSSFAYSRTIPEIADYDVVVVGGGMGGVGAACAAAHGGARTLLIERFAQLGGMATIGGVCNWAYGGPLEGQGRVFDEQLRIMRRMGAIGEDKGWPAVLQIRENSRGQEIRYYNNLFDHNILPVVLQHQADKAGVDLLYHTELTDVVMKGKAVEAVVIHNRSLLQAVRARIVVDATGDGVLGRHAGAQVIPEGEEYTRMPAGFMIFLSGNNKLEVLPEFYPEGEEPYEKLSYGEFGEDERTDIASKYEEDHCFWVSKCRRGKIWIPPGGVKGHRLPNGSGAVKLRVHGFDTSTGEGLSAAEQFTRSLIPEIVRCAGLNLESGVKIDSVPPMLGLRQGPRIMGEYVLSVDDVKQQRIFEDSVAFGGAGIDTVNHFVDHWVPPYQVPLRSLIAQGLDNLFVVGRCVSADFYAWSSLRVMTTCCLLGQAAGTAAAICIRENIPIRDVDPEGVREVLISGADHPELMRQRMDPAAVMSDGKSNEKKRRK